MMKKLLLLLSILCLFVIVQAQVSKTIDLSTAGTLSSLLTATEKTTITNLTITGNIDVTDIKCMRSEMTVLSSLDLSASTIKAYIGNGGTSSNSTSYLANVMPEYSFCNSFTETGKATLITITLPNSITSIGNVAFYNCSSLINVTIPDAVTSLGDVTFGGCKSLTTIKIPNSTTTIGNSTFKDCWGLTTITIPDVVTTIANTAFYGCRGLKSLTIGKKVISIGSQSFDDCTSLKTIYSLNTIPPTIISGCFPNPNVVTAVYVPALSVSAYKAAAGWSDYFMSVIMANNVYGITVNIGVGGIVKENNETLNNGSLLSVNPGSTKTFTFAPFDGYQIATLSYNGIDVKSQISNNQFTTPAVNANATLNVTFQKIQYILSLKSAESGSIDLLCDYGATPSFRFTPIAGWKVNTVSYNNNDVTSPLLNGIFTVPSISNNAVLNVSFVSIVNGAPELVNSKITVYTKPSEIIVEGTSEGEIVELYTVSGKQIQTVRSQGENIILPAQGDAVYLVKTASKKFKVIL